MVIGHKKQWDFLKKKFEQNQLAHAYLFSGQDEIGKKFFAKEFAEFIGCKFPDLMVVEPDEGKEIPIAKIREVQNFLAYKSYNGGFKIVVVNDAERMNNEAQSCFLKTLEEPKGKTLLMLVSSRPDMLLPTIFSRCQTVKFFKPKDLPVNPDKIKKEQKILQDLLNIIDSDLAVKFQYVKKLNPEGSQVLKILDILQRYFRYLMILKISAEDSKGTAGDYPLSKIKKIINLIEKMSLSVYTTNANPKLALEIILMEA